MTDKKCIILYEDHRSDIQVNTNMTDVKLIDTLHNSYVKARMKNLFIISCKEKLIIMGSFPKWYFGNNLKAFNFYTFKKCIKKLNKDLGFPINNAIIKQLEIGINLEMKFNPLEYMTSVLASRNKLNMLVGSGSVGLFNRSSKIIFYDKLKELEEKEGITNLVQNNVLRVEYGYKKNFPKISGKTVRVKDMLVKENYIRILTRFYKMFSNVKFLYKKKHVMRSSETSKEFIESIFIEAMENMSPIERHNNLANFIKNSQERYKLRKKMQLLNKKNITMSNELEEELKYKVLSAVLQQLKKVYKGYPELMKESLNEIFQIHKLIMNS